jgi:hypothetical protein
MTIVASEVSMPFRSEAQKRWMFANNPNMAEQWAKDTPAGAKLPERAKPAKKSSKRQAPASPAKGHW